jgi:outer membrane protein assembly factor BamE (lipoprotein component of BamABCDE complex)
MKPGKAMNSNQKIIFLLPALAILTACSASHHASEVRSDEGERITVGVVQKEIVIGMSGAEVAAVLGSPNIVSTDENRNETWIYDKISSDVTYSRSSGTVVGLIFAGGGGGAGVGSSSSGASSTSQRTLTVIIKFDENGQVGDFSYHSSRF